MPTALDYGSHPRDLHENRYVYAVVSRRARGLSIGVNMNPDRVCNFDCPYCQVDRTEEPPSGQVDVDVLGSELEALLALHASGELWTVDPFGTVAPSLRRVADIAFAGDGEPTSPREFTEAAATTRRIRDARGLDVPLRLLTNATLFDRPRVREGLALFDELWCKLDAGTEEHFRLASGSKFPLSRILSNLLSVARERPIVVQSLFFAFDGRPPEGERVEAWAQALKGIVDQEGHIDHVQVYTVARRPASPLVGPLTDEQLEAIAS